MGYEGVPRAGPAVPHFGYHSGPGLNRMNVWDRASNNLPPMLADEDLVRLETADLSAVVPEGHRRRVIAMVVHAIMSAPIGTRIDRPRLETLLESTFRTLFKGSKFDFNPVLKALLRVKGVTEHGLYVPIVNLRILLETMDIHMEEPALSLGQETRAELLDAAEHAAEIARAAYQARDHRRSRERKLRLGDLLVSEGLITPADLETALSFQKRFGGRIGSNLVLLGLVSEASLAKFLSVQLGLPCCLSETEINSIPREVAQVLPREFAVERSVLPLRIEKTRLHLAMVDPSDLVTRDEAGFRTGGRVVPVVAPEVLVAYGLEKQYGHRRTTPLLRQRSGVSAAVPLASSPGVPVRSSGGMRWVSLPGAEVPPEEEATQKVAVVADLDDLDLPPPAPERAGERAPGRSGVPALGRALASAREMKDVYGALLGYLSSNYERAAIFLLENGKARGWRRATGRSNSKAFRRASIEIGGGVGVFSHVLALRRSVQTALVTSDENDALIEKLDLRAGDVVTCVPFADVGGICGFAVAAHPLDGEVPQAELDAAETATTSALKMLALKKQLLAMGE